MSKPNYFQVSITHYSQPQSIRITQKYGWQGYGIYFVIMQLLASAPNRRFKLTDLPQIAYLIRVTYDEKFIEMINFMFTVVNDEFYSEDVENGVLAFEKRIKNLNPSAAGKASAAKLTPEQLSERGKHAASAKENTPTPPKEKDRQIDE